MSSESFPTFSWLNIDFLNRITKTKHAIFHNDFVIEKHETSFAAAKGDNYLGVVFRLKVYVIFNANKHHITDYYIIKTSDGEVVSGSNALVNEFQAYQIEMEAYEVILPALQSLWKTVGQEVQFGPRCYGVFRESADIIVLEDLREEGYYVLDRHTAFSMEQISQILQLLAKFHAASTVYVSKNGPVSPTFNRGMFSKQFSGKAWGNHYNQLYKTFRSILNEWDGFEDIATKIEIHGNKIYESCCTAMECKSDDIINVLNHGDTWITNILLCNDANFKTKVKLIDFQFASWGSPAQDLWFFISTSIGIDDRINKFESIVNEYYTHFKESLIMLKFNGAIPTVEDLHEDLVKRGIISLGITTESFAGISLDKGMQIDFEIVARNDLEAETFRRKIFNNSRFINTTKKFLKFLDQKGIFH